MKTKNLMLLFCLLFLIGCSENETPIQKTDLYVYLDYTEGQNYHSVEADLDNYLKIMHVTDEEPSNYGTIKLFPLYDIGSTPSSTVKLNKGKSKMESNRYLRQQEVDKFKTKVMEKVEAMNAQYSNKHLKKSHIVQPLFKGFAKIEKSKADRKVVLIYSDMLENSKIANFHKGIKTDKLMATLQQYWTTEDLSDLEVYIVHPIDKGNDQKIQTSGDFWKSFLTNKGLDEDLFHFDTGIEV